MLFPFIQCTVSDFSHSFETGGHEFRSATYSHNYYLIGWVSLPQLPFSVLLQSLSPVFFSHQILPPLHRVPREQVITKLTKELLLVPICLLNLYNTTDLSDEPSLLPDREQYVACKKSVEVVPTCICCMSYYQMG